MKMTTSNDHSSQASLSAIENWNTVLQSDKTLLKRSTLYSRERTYDPVEDIWSEETVEHLAFYPDLFFPETDDLYGFQLFSLETELKVSPGIIILGSVESPKKDKIYHYRNEPYIEMECLYVGGTHCFRLSHKQKEKLISRGCNVVATLTLSPKDDRKSAIIERLRDKLKPQIKNEEEYKRWMYPK